MRGVKSFGMLMAASDAAHENVELLVPPEGAVPGERVWFGSIDEKENLPDVVSPNQAILFINTRLLLLYPMLLRPSCHKIFFFVTPLVYNANKFSSS